MGSIPAGTIRMGMSCAKKERQTYVSLLTNMDVSLFLFGDACDEEDRRSSNSKVSCTAQYYRAPARDQESGAFEVRHGL